MTFPADLDAFPATADLADDTLADKPHSTLHGNLGVAVAAVEAKIGVDSSAVTSSLDYKVAQLEAHVTDATDAHAASAISILDTAADFAATDVEGALAELQSDAEAHVAAADPHTGYVLESLLDAQGDLIVASGADTPARLALGAVGQTLVSDGSTLGYQDPVLVPGAGWNSLLAWTEDVTFCSGSKIPGAATIYLRKIMVPVTTTFTNLLVSVAVAGTNYTNTQVGLYSSAGTLLGQSAVMASAGTNTFGTQGVKTIALTVIGGQSLTVTGSPTAFVWAAIHMGTNATTAATFHGPTTPIAATNAGLTASTARAGSYTGHATNDLGTIGNITPASIGVAIVPGPWFGVT